jgi:nucleotide-binding universal stress UspA family protein
MLKILVPVDGSPHADRAVAQVVELAKSGAQVELHLITVQMPIDGHARSFVSQEDLEAYHREEGLAALANARRILDEAGVAYHHHIAVGHVAETIVRYAAEHHFDKIVMGSHGRGGLLDVLLGSVARDVVRHATVPVTLVKPGPAAQQSVPANPPFTDF